MQFVITLLKPKKIQSTEKKKKKKDGSTMKQLITEAFKASTFRDKKRGHLKVLHVLIIE